MSPSFQYQGSVVWEASRDLIKQLLYDAGCTDVFFEWGNMD